MRRIIIDQGISLCRSIMQLLVLQPTEIAKYLDYIHYNPVKQGDVSYPHLWPYSSFHHWVNRGDYQVDWGCQCDGKQSLIPDFTDIIYRIGV